MWELQIRKVKVTKTEEKFCAALGIFFFFLMGVSVCRDFVTDLPNVR